MGINNVRDKCIFYIVIKAYFVLLYECIYLKYGRSLKMQLLSSFGNFDMHALNLVVQVLKIQCNRLKKKMHICNIIRGTQSFRLKVDYSK